MLLPAQANPVAVLLADLLARPAFAAVAFEGERAAALVPQPDLAP